MADGPLVWERFEWSAGADRYRFEIEQGGVLATLSALADGGPREPRRLTLPMVAWEGLLDSLKTTRKARGRPQQAGLPARFGARWSDSEVGELAAGFDAGRTIAELAHSHGRTAIAIESQLVKIGRMERTDDGRAVRRMP